jgi:uracil-DNA glycosylase family 4
MVKDEVWERLNAEVVSCRRCPRLVGWREEVARTKRRAYVDWDYWGRAVPGFGDREARLLIIGLAPGAHGANRTGRVFTGDSSGDFLFAPLHRYGFANQPTSRSVDDGLALDDAYITAVVRCVPPKNRPRRPEKDNCRPFLERELALLEGVEVVLVLGRIAYDEYRRLLRDEGHEVRGMEFRHGACYDFGPDAPTLVVSYHPSRQNTQTGVLTAEMFDGVFAKIRALLDGAGGCPAEGDAEG